MYIFKTEATMKPYNRDKWWIDKDIIREKRINASSLYEAILKYRDRLRDEDNVFITDNALLEKQPMYIDKTDGSAKQTGYVITAKTAFDNEHGSFVYQNIFLWVEILQTIDISFPEEEDRVDDE